MLVSGRQLPFRALSSATAKWRNPWLDSSLKQAGQRQLSITISCSGLERRAPLSGDWVYSTQMFADCTECQCSHEQQSVTKCFFLLNTKPKQLACFQLRNINMKKKGLNCLLSSITFTNIYFLFNITLHLPKSMYVFQRETLDKHDIFIFLFWLLLRDRLLAPSILLCYTNPLHSVGE